MAPKKTGTARVAKKAAVLSMKAASEKKKAGEKKAVHHKKQLSRGKSTASMASRKSQRGNIEDSEDEETSAAPWEDDDNGSMLDEKKNGVKRSVPNSKKRGRDTEEDMGGNNDDEGKKKECKKGKGLLKERNSKSKAGGINKKEDETRGGKLGEEEESPGASEKPKKGGGEKPKTKTTAKEDDEEDDEDKDKEEGSSGQHSSVDEDKDKEEGSPGQHSSDDEEESKEEKKSAQIRGDKEAKGQAPFNPAVRSKSTPKPIKRTTTSTPTTTTSTVIADDNDQVDVNLEEKKMHRTAGDNDEPFAQEKATKQGFLSIPKEEMPSQRRRRRKILTLEEKRRIGREYRKQEKWAGEGPSGAAEADIIPAPGDRAQDLLARAQKVASQNARPKVQADRMEEDEAKGTPQNARIGGVGGSPNFNSMLTHNLATKKHFHEALGKLGSFVDDGGAPTPTTASSHGERQVRTPNSITTNKIVSPGSASLCSEKAQEKQEVKSDDKPKRKSIGKKPEKVNISPMKEILKHAMLQFTLDDDEVLEVLNNFKTIFLSEAVLKKSTIGTIVTMISSRTSDQEVKEVSKKLLDAWKNINSKSVPHPRARIGTFDLSEIQPKPAPVGTDAPAPSEVAPISID